MSAPAEEVERTLQLILEREQFRDLRRSDPTAAEVFGEMLQSLMRTLTAFIGELRGEHPGVFVALVIVGLVVVSVSVWLGARGAARRRHSDVVLREELPELLRGDPLRLQREAEAAAGRGDWLEAVRLQFRSTIIRRALAEGALEKDHDADGFRRARTYRELVREFARNDQQNDLMTQLAERLESGLYAGVALGPNDWENVQRLARDLR